MTDPGTREQLLRARLEDIVFAHALGTDLDEAVEAARTLLADTDASRCRACQHSDQMVCAPCGQAWDVNDPDPPPCRPVALRLFEHGWQLRGARACLNLSRPDLAMLAGVSLETIKMIEGQDRVTGWGRSRIQLTEALRGAAAFSFGTGEMHVRLRD